MDATMDGSHADATSKAGQRSEPMVEMALEAVLETL